MHHDALDKSFIEEYVKKNTSLASSSINISVFQTIDSTNTQAKKLSPEMTCTGTILFAEQQTGGRGRMGKTFFSPPYTGIYLSALYTPITPVFDPAHITATAAVAVCKAVSTVCGKECGIKWVNDVFLNDRKICGILAEGILDPSAGTFRSIVIGIGINVFEQDNGFPSDIAQTAGTVFSNRLNKTGHTDAPPSQTQTEKPPSQTLTEKPTSFSRSHLAAAIVSSLYTLLEEDFSEVLNEYRKRSIVIGKTVTVLHPSASYKALVTGISDEAHLLAVPEGTDKTVALCSGEISIKLDS